MVRITGEPDPRQYSDFGRKVAALLGSDRDWENSSDLLNMIGDIADEFEFKAFDTDNLDFWREVADEVDIDYEADDSEGTDD